MPPWGAVRSVLPSLLTALAVFGVVIWLGRVQPGQARIVADFESDGGAATELFLNGATEPARVPTRLGRFRYEFGVSSPAIKGIRLDPVDVAEVRVRLYGIEVQNDEGRIVARYDAAAVRQWTMRGLAVVELTGDALVLRTTSEDPMLIGSVEPIHLERTTSMREGAAARLRAEPGLAFLLLLPLLALLEIRPYGAWFRRTVAAAAVCAACPAIFSAVSKLDWGPTPAEVAVSRAAYLGASLPALQAGMLVTIAATAVAGVLLAFLFRRAPPSVTSGGVALPPSWRFTGLAVLGLALLNAPDLAGISSWTASQQFAPHWDYDNIRYWTYWTAHGAIPFRDFWYPYAGMFLFDLSWPAGPLITWAAAVGREAVFLAALTLIVPGRRIEVLLATAALVAAETVGLNLASARYLLGANVILAYAGALRWGFRGGLPLLTLATALVMALVFELTQLLYAVPGVASIAALDAARFRKLNALWRGPAVCAAAIASLALAAVLWRAGMLTAVWDYHRRLADTVQYAALPATISIDSWKYFRSGTLVVWFPCVALIIGFVELRRPDAESFRRATALIALSLLGFATLQKHLVRPMPDTLLFDAIVTGLVFGALTPRGHLSQYRLGAGEALGLLVGLLAIEGQLGRVVSSATSLPSRLGGTARLLASGPALAEANRVRFAPERFALYTTQRRLADELARRQNGPVRLFTLTDDPIAYLMTGQPPVRHVNLYNGSPLYEQQQIIDDLRRAPPDYVVALRGRLSFDAVPVVVRVPDVIGFVMEHYVPDEPAEPYVVLRPRLQSERAPFDLWSGLFGNRLDLGLLPAAFGRVERPACAQGHGCEELIILTPSAQVTDIGQETAVTLTIGDAEIVLRIGLVPGASRYVIPISRLWPAVAAAAAGLTVDVAAPPGFAVERKSAGRVNGWLY